MRKLVAVLLALIMMVGLLPVESAFARGGGGRPARGPRTNIPNSRSTANSRKSQKDAKKLRERKRREESDSLLDDAGGYRGR